MATPKKKNLADVLAKAKAGQDKTMPPRITTAPINNEPPIKEAAPKITSVAASREGKKPIAAYLSPETHMQLKILAAKRSTTIQELSEQAYAMLLAKFSD
jgi:hypothetical protein